MNPDQFFNHILPQILIQDPDALSMCQVRSRMIGVELDQRQGGGAWVLNFDAEGRVQVGEWPSDRAVETAIRTTRAVFQGMMDGTLNIPVAFLMGKIKLQGNKEQVIAVGKALRRVIQNHSGS